MSSLICTIKKIGIICVFYKFFGRLCPKDSGITSACDRIGAYRYLMKYKHILKQTVLPLNENRIKKDIIWLCWLQGYDNAPPLVQKCRESVLKHNPDMSIIILDNSNLDKYIQLPKQIKFKHDIGIIPHAHYTDIIRISLLAQYGGTWIDATAFATAPLPDYIRESELFCFKRVPLGKCVGSNWLISAAPNNPIILQMRSLLFCYWKNENKLISYSIFHLFWSMIIELNETNNLLWNNVPYFDDINCNILQMELFNLFSSKRFLQIMEMSPIHKLTYKFEEDATLQDSTFYKFIINVNQ